MNEKGSAAFGRFNLAELHCYGCAHSAASEPFPGRPSGERPCCFCIRRPETGRKLKTNEPLEANTWYDGSQPVRVPMDCYHTLDMKDQIQRWTQ